MSFFTISYYCDFFLIFLKFSWAMQLVSQQILPS